MSKYLLGTRFYAYRGHSNIPIVIRLNKENTKDLSFICGGNQQTLTSDDINLCKEDSIPDGNHWEITSSNEYGDILTRYVSIGGVEFAQTWTPKTSETGKFVIYDVEKVYIKMIDEQLKSEFIKLNPDGFITISNIFYKTNVDPDGFDVLFTMHKGNERIPFAICRQDVVDIYNFKSDDTYVPIGCCISATTCPKNIDMNMFMYAEKVKDFKAAAFYADDSLKSMMKYLGSLNKYNATIRKLSEKYKNTKMAGCCSNIFELLERKYIMGEFNIANKIRTWPFYLDLNKNELSADEVMEFNKLFDVNASAVVYTPYTREIDFDKLGGNYRILNSSNAGNGFIYKSLMVFAYK